MQIMRIVSRGAARAVATRSKRNLRHDPVTSTTPRGLPAWGPRFAPGSDTLVVYETACIAGRLVAVFLLFRRMAADISVMINPTGSGSRNVMAALKNGFS